MTKNKLPLVNIYIITHTYTCEYIYLYSCIPAAGFNFIALIAKLIGAKMM